METAWVAQQMGMSASLAWNATNLLHLHSHKTTGIINLFDTDHEAKLHILNWYLHGEYADVDPSLVLITFEMYFHYSGYMNSQNNRYWCPILSHEGPLHNATVVVWCTVRVSRIIWSIYFETANIHWYVIHILMPVLWMSDCVWTSAFFSKMV
jgi:hypothetical protein